MAPNSLASLVVAIVVVAVLILVVHRVLVSHIGVRGGTKSAVRGTAMALEGLTVVCLFGAMIVEEVMSAADRLNSSARPTLAAPEQHHDHSAKRAQQQWSVEQKPVAESTQSVEHPSSEGSPSWSKIFKVFVVLATSLFVYALFFRFI